MKMNIRKMVVGYVFCALAIPAITHAAIKTDAVRADRVTVTYNVADLETSEGKAGIYQEIELAAKQVCAASRARSAGMRQTCFNEVVETAKQELDENAAKNVATLDISSI